MEGEGLPAAISALSVAVLFLLSVLGLRYYARKELSLFTFVCCWVGCALSLSIIGALPLDIVYSMSRRPASLLPPKAQAENILPSKLLRLLSRHPFTVSYALQHPQDVTPRPAVADALSFTASSAPTLASSSSSASSHSASGANASASPAGASSLLPVSVGEYRRELLLLLCVSLSFIYIVGCTYSGVFHLRLAGYFGLYGNHRTDSQSLIFCASTLCKLAAPLCFHFLQLLHFHGTAFEEFYGQAMKRSMPFFGGKFTLYFPLLVSVLGLCNLFNVLNRILAALGLRELEFDPTDEQATIQEGKLILNNEMKKRKLAQNQRRLETRQQQQRMHRHQQQQQFLQERQQQQQLLLQERHQLHQQPRGHEEEVAAHHPDAALHADGRQAMTYQRTTQDNHGGQNFGRHVSFASPSPAAVQMTPVRNAPRAAGLPNGGASL
eukprot:GHVT01101200.1.p1 GENE.GHVT01101200.1~~GHVT01101200.1.p1  ORF type:complete len:438 (+),score=124.02 GHVT01101200.1:978-2291(+)